ncbi:MAG: hypothetical protein HQM08_26135 [Candidatus Riflebacteria bacterium]|nr:hypothetical protein [Candidatus Riflebacteria bacterium]
MDLFNFPHYFFNDKCIFCGTKSDSDPALKFRENQAILQENHKILELLDEQFQHCSQAPFFYSIFVIVILSFFFYLFSDFLMALIVFLVAIKGARSFAEWNTDWFFLGDVKEEYEKISAYLKIKNKNYFQRQIDEIIGQLKIFRNKASLVLNIVTEESESEIGQKINILELKLKESKDPELTRIYTSQIKDLHDRISKLSDIFSFVDKFLTHRDGILNSLKLLRTKLLLTETSADDKEIEGTIEELRSLHVVFERINENLKI